MKKTLTLLLALFFTTGPLLAQQPLPISRVLLYKNGMAYIVRSGRLDGPLSLSFHPDEMNDVLKTFTAWNPNNGSLYSVGYTTGIPSDHMLGRFPFDLRDPALGLAGFLAQIKGAEIKLELTGRSLEGKLVAVNAEDRATSAQTVVKEHQLTILQRSGTVQSVWMSEVRSFELSDPQLRQQLRTYLDVLAEGRQDVTREVSIYPVPAAGPVNAAYLQQFPLWKTSYRVDLNGTENRIQGWAQIDNPTGESWENVELTLLSGMPVSFHMNLYEPLYTSRSTVRVPGSEVAAPRSYEAPVATADATEVRGFAKSMRGNIVTSAETASPPPPPAAAMSGVLGGVLRPESSGGFQEAEASRVQDYFEYRFPFPIRLGSRQSALLPFLNKTLAVERLSIFNARTDRNNPYNGASVENNTGVPLEAGPITFFQDGRYAGEAVLSYLSRGEKRLVSYGVDHDIQVSASQQAQPETTTRLTVSRGIAVFHRESVQTTRYQLRNKAGQAKTLLIEHPRQSDRSLKEAKPSETTDSFYRFRISLAASQETELPVTEVISRRTSVSLREMNRNQLALFGNETPAAVRQKIEEIVGVQEKLVALRTEVKTTEGSVESIFRDQERLRENLKALRETREDRDLRVRYLEQLAAQETRVEELRTRIEDLNKQIASLESQLASLLSNLSWQG